MFPDIFKIAKITPVFKKGQKNILKNYRPISVLSNLSKITESVMYDRLQSFFSSQNILSEKQFGFRKDRSTEMAIMDLIFKLLPALQNKKFAIVVFLDYSACFDTISRHILLKKLDQYGVRGKELKWFTSYLSDRRQYVVFNNAQSEIAAQDIGVVQGSRLGPLLYDIYANDFNSLCALQENILYADDTCCVYVGDNLIDLTAHVNNRLSVINDWCCENKLFLNRKKSEFMVITTKNIDIVPELFIGTDKLKPVNSFKYLGVNIGSDMKFHTHVDNLCTRISQVCGASFRIRRHIDLPSARKLYFSTFYTIVQYCIAIYGGFLILNCEAQKLMKLQDKMMKNVFLKFFPSSDNLYKSLNILKLSDIYKLRVGVLMYRTIVLNECPTIQNNLVISYPQHNYTTRNSNLLIPPFPRVEAIRMNFQYQFVQIWNNIPDHIKHKPSLNAFKKALMKDIVDNY